jgi:hypothetical protein
MIDWGALKGSRQGVRPGSGEHSDVSQTGAGAELSDSDYSEADEVQAPPKRKTPAKPSRATRLAALLSNGYSGPQQGGDSPADAEEDRATRDAFWHGFGGTSKVLDTALKL